MRLLEQIDALHAQAPDATMVEVLGDDGLVSRSYTRGQVHGAVLRLAARLDALAAGGAVLGLRSAKVGLVMKNSPEWVVADLALLRAGQVEVPVPLAFAAEQALYLLDGVDVCLVDRDGQTRLKAWLASAPTGTRLPAMWRVDVDDLLAQPLPGGSLALDLGDGDGDDGAGQARAFDDDDVCKTIHTSGTTSRPKGVRIRQAGLAALMASLRERIEPGHYRRYLSLVPLSLLIEQVTAAYMTFLEGGTLVFLPPSQPLLGESGATTRGILPWLKASRATALTLPPAMVETLLAACRAHPGEAVAARCERLFGHDEPAFIACGGAPTAPAVLAELRRFGIPVYEGYGLSENSSVVAWNAPGCFKAGTVGRPLGHVRVKLADDGELLVWSTSLFAGYAGSDPSSCEVDADGWLHTGDVGAIDAEGFIRVFGRKKNVIITANGRNVSPEWVESRYKSLDCVDQAVVFGDGLEALHGYFVIHPAFTPAQARAQIIDFGLAHLSDVERVDHIVTAPAQPALYERCFTVTGRPRRDVIWRDMQQPDTDTHAKTREEETCLI